MTCYFPGSSLFLNPGYQVGIGNACTWESSFGQSLTRNLLENSVQDYSVPGIYLLGRGEDVLKAQWTFCIYPPSLLLYP